MLKSQGVKGILSLLDAGTIMADGMFTPAAFFFYVFLLLEPSFVGSAYIQESLPKGNPVGDDDKIYFFFSEFNKTARVDEEPYRARIGRICTVREPPDSC